MQRTIDEALLSDQDWADLMAAEYAAGGRQLDQVTEARIWRRTEAALGAAPRGLARGALAGPLAMVAILCLALYSFVGRGLLAPYAGIKGFGDDAGQPVSLIGYEMVKDGALLPFYTSDPRVGMTLVFKTVSPKDGLVALLMMEGGDDPVVRFVGSPARAGSEQLLERGGRAYGFNLDEKLRTPVRFCVVSESSPVRLQALLADPGGLWPKIDPGACLQISSLGGR